MTRYVRMVDIFEIDVPMQSSPGGRVYVVSVHVQNRSMNKFVRTYVCDFQTDVRMLVDLVRTGTSETSSVGYTYVSNVPTHVHPTPVNYFVKVQYLHNL